jgi:hypothetical protein
MNEAWRGLRVGDRIRFVAMPPEWDRPGYYVHRDTRRLVRRLIERRRPLRVSKVDEWGVPWVECRFRRPAGGWVYHSLSIIESGWVRVRSRLR